MERSWMQSSRAAAFHGFRVVLLVVIVWLIHDQHRRFEAERLAERASALTLRQAQLFFPDVAEISASPSYRGGRAVLNADGTTLGFIIQTSPASDEITGYSGSTNSILAFDTRGQITGVGILHSDDTVEHVRTVQEDERFMTALVGKDWQSAAEAQVDTVSGATLTSLAMLEGINRRLGGTAPSSRFPHEPTVDDVRVFFPTAARIAPRADTRGIHDAFDAADERIGCIVRTSPSADDVMGYQGPTDTLIACDPNDKVIGITVLTSYDNEPYVGYVRDDAYFRKLFNGMSLKELSEFDPRAAQVEGVSGATMTSLAVANGLPKAAAAAIEPAPSIQRKIRIAARDIGTLIVLATAIAIGFSRLRGMAWARFTFQLVLIGYFGFINGDLISQTLLVGWAQSGVPWRFAPGLAILTAAAFLLPIATKRNVYCHHVCPFGAAQQLIRNRLPWRVHVSAVMTRLLSMLPAALLLLVLLTAILHWPLNLAGIEPFDAFLFRIAGVSTLVVAIVGLASSAFVPMAYCRFGCPTGAVLSYVRRHAAADRFTRRDAVALIFVAVALVLRLV